MSRLITASLIGSIDWLQKCPQSWKAKAAKDLKNTLARVWSEPNEAIKLGIKFEDYVVKATQQPADSIDASEHFKWVVEEVRGGEFQRKTVKNIEIDGHEYCLYGKIDAWFPDIIKDIKTTSNYKGIDHYLNSFQHKLYCYNEGINKFRYVIAEFDSNQKTIAHHAVDVEFTDPAALEAEVISTVKEAVKFLSASTELFELYTTKFSKH